MNEEKGMYSTMTVVRRWWIAVLVMALLVPYAIPAPASAAAGKRSDIQGHWAEAAMAKWAEQGRISGYPDGTLRPDADISRAEWMKLVNRLFGYEGRAAASFSDVRDGAWYAAEVSAAVQAGYINGYKDGTMKPEHSLTRAEAAAMLARLGKLTDNAAAADRFADELPAWSRGSIGAATAAGWLKGYPDGSFGPAKPISRAEAVTVLDRLEASLKPEDDSSQRVYDRAGSYGPVNGIEAIDGDVVVSASGVELRNMVVKGDLTIAESVADGDVRLQGVIVEGELSIYGGGENSIFLSDSEVDAVIVDKADGKVRLAVSGSSSVATAAVGSGAILEEAELTGGTGFEAVRLAESIPSKAVVQLSGNFTDVRVDAGDIRLELKAGSIETLEIGPSVKGLVVYLAEGTVVSKAILHGEATFTGPGVVLLKEGSGSLGGSGGSSGSNPGGGTPRPEPPTVREIVKGELGEALLRAERASASLLQDGVSAAGIRSVTASVYEPRGTDWYLLELEGATYNTIYTLQFAEGIAVANGVQTSVSWPKATVTGLVYAPASVHLTELGATEQIQLIAEWSDGTEQDVAHAASWSSDNEQIATVTDGLVRATGVGMTQISASYGGYSVQIPVSVTTGAYGIAVMVDTTSPIAGAENTIRFTVTRSNGETDTSFNGLHRVTVTGILQAPDGSYGRFGGAAASSTGAQADVQFTNGVGEVKLAIHGASPHHLLFSIDGVVQTVVPFGVTVANAAGAALKIETQPSGAIDGKPLEVQPVVRVVDAYGNHVNNAGISVTAEVAEGYSSTLFGMTTIPAVNGVASFADLGLNGTAQEVKLAFTASGPASVESDPFPVKAPFVEGDGSAQEPYVIETPEQLNAVRNYLDANFVLESDIDLSGYAAGAGWEPIGALGKPFTGTFDGNGHIISGLTIRSANQDVGLFGNVGGSAVIRNVGVEGANVEGAHFNIGILIGHLAGGMIEDSYAKGSVSNSNAWYTGGLIGRVGAVAVINRSYADVIVNGYRDTGGLVGSNEGTITESYALGAISSNYIEMGGLAGENLGTILQSYAQVTITGGTGDIGGLVGINRGHIEESYAAGVISSSSSSKGGLVGANSGSVAFSYYDRELTGQNDAGKGDPLTTNEMKNQASFSGWSFTDVWGIKDGYPYLLWQ
ncbi:S-layer homology domain-containing protein [Paenibacillaceae bacterium WGS1546]|uniref:S-layer homology domain-containing protein n=1 Tax=Cohnella sp. WGS1546 TaxID=3366810 RepID=UPI00372D4677